MGLQIVLSNTAAQPIYEQIEDQIKAAILGGEVAPGDALPSIRGLARDLRVSVITTTRAYGDLAALGFITNVPGKGSFVLARDPEELRAHVRRDVDALLREGARKAGSAGITPTELHALLDEAIATEGSQP